jgi:hypothetical protein
MMFGFGWLGILLVFVVPVLVLILLLGRADIFHQNRGTKVWNNQDQSPPIPPVHYNQPSNTPAGRHCSHCGTGLQPDWAHCPQCGAPIPD